MVDTTATTSTTKALSLLEAYPLPASSSSSSSSSTSNISYAYGTAGFRYAAAIMAPVMVRVGLVARWLLLALLSLSDTGNNTIGVMITASHNDESYNGVKISNPDGSMIGAAQEDLLVRWVNERDLDVWKKALLEQQQQQQEAEASHPGRRIGTLIVGRDTRSHSSQFSDLMIQAARSVGVTVVDHGVLTTPMLHHIVLYSNKNPKLASRQAYLTQMAQAYITIDQALATKTNMVTTLPPLQVDGACGVGYQATVDLQATLATLDSRYANPRFQARNPPTAGPLNVQCGSEHVQKQLEPPIWYDSVDDNNGTTDNTSSSNSYCCSVDGDADRIVFWANHPEWTLLDGDKIAVLIATFFREILPSDSSLTLGVVQTAYANGASTKYLRETLKIPVVVTKTGVKHLHHAALGFDIGIYFEANGHGTVLFSENYHQQFCNNDDNNSQTAVLLSQLPKLINPAVGDALSDLLLVDLLLRRYYGWTLPEWANDKLYQDFPSRQLKVQVKDRTRIICNENETQALEPPALQPALERAMMATGTGRCFVRPSGTENVVRIYAEASTRAAADRLATQAAQIVQETCDGVGPLPKI